MAGNPASLPAAQAEALTELVRALAPGYRRGLRWQAMLYQAYAGTPALAGRARPEKAAAHRAAEAALTAERLGLHLAGVDEETVARVIAELDREQTSR